MTRPGGAGLHAFVGRERELATLTSALEAAERGSGGAYLLRGEAGIGKTRTAREIVGRARERGFAVGVGHCADGDAAPSYGPWRRALQDTSAWPELAARGAESAEEPDLADERRRLFGRIEAALREDAAKRPQLVLLEDLHWADVDSLRLLQHLARRLGDVPWLALGTQRDDEPMDEPRARALARLARETSAVPLGPLDEAEVETLVSHWSAEPPPPELVRAARRRSGGNPLFLCELIALVVAQQGRVSLAALESAGIPDLLLSLLDRRLEQLPQTSRQVLAQGAVLGDPFDLAELAGFRAESPDAVLAALEPVERLRLLEASGEFSDRFAFSHALVRDAVLARLPRARRAAVHRDVAAWLEASGRNRSEPELARLADHHRRGLASDSAARAVDCAFRAAALARHERAPHQAVRHLRLALDSLTGVELSADERARRRCDLLLALGEALSQAGERPRAHEAYLEAAEGALRLGWAEALARAAIGMVGRDEDTRGVSAEAQRWVERALEALDDGDTPLRAGLLALASRLAGGRGEERHSEALARAALEVAERVSRPETVASASHALHTALGRAESLDERLALSSRMVEAAARGASRRTELRARQRRFTDLLQIGDAVGAEEELARIETLAREHDWPAFRWHALTLAAGRDLWRGRLASAERKMAECFEQGRRAGMRNAGALYAVQMFHLRERQGRLHELRPGLQEMVEKNPQIPSLRLVVPLVAMQEDDELLTRSTFEPLAAQGFEDVPRDSDWLAVMTSTARVAAYLRDRERCDQLLQKLHPYEGWCVVLPDGQDWEGSVARHLALLEGVLGRVDEARTHFRGALACHRRAGALPLVAQTLYEFGRFEAEAGRDEEAARGMLREALALYRQLDVALFAERAEAALAALHPRGERRARPHVARGRGGARLERRGAQWRLDFAGRRAFVEHRKGLDDLAALLAEPGRDVHCLDLMRPTAVGSQRPRPAREEATLDGPAGLPGADPAALSQYRARLAELRAEREEALARGDLAARDARDAEIAWLERELLGAFGARRGAASDFAQKARKAVYNRLRAAVAAIAEVHPELGRHLRHSLQTGVVCVYRPEAPVEWEVRADGAA